MVQTVGKKLPQALSVVALMSFVVAGFAHFVQVIQSGQTEHYAWRGVPQAQAQEAPPLTRLLVGSTATNSILNYDLPTGAISETFIVSQNLGLSGPRGLAFGPDGNLYVSSHSTNSVMRYNGMTGEFIDTFVAPGSGGLTGPTCLIFGADGNLYVSNGSSNNILRFNGATGEFIDALVTVGGELLEPRGLLFGPDGTLYASSSGTNSILRFDITTGAFLGVFVSSDPQSNGGLSHPTGFEFGPDGNGDGIGDLYVNSFDTNSILLYDGASGAFISALVADDPATEGVDESNGLFEPVGLAFGADGNLYVSGFSSSSVRRYDPAGMFLGVFVADNPASPGINESGGLLRAPELIFGPDGALYVSSFGNHRILRYDGATGGFRDVFAPNRGGLTDIQSGQLANPIGMAIGPNGTLYVSSFDTNSIQNYDVTAGAFIVPFVADDPTTLDIDESGGLFGPTTLLFGPDANGDGSADLYVSSFNTNAVKRFDGATGAFIDDFVADDPATLDVDETGGLNGPAGLIIGPDGNFYVGSRLTNTVLLYEGATGAFIRAFVADDPATMEVNEAGGLEQPGGLAFDAAGNFYVSSSATNQVLRYDPMGQFLGVFVTDNPVTQQIDESGGLLSPRDLAFGPDGSLFVASNSTDNVLLYNGATGQFISALLPRLRTFGRPVGLLFVP
jgi:sugar lactone lactonase YvrE